MTDPTPPPAHTPPGASPDAVPPSAGTADPLFPPVADASLPQPPAALLFARGVGILLQTAGFLLFLSHCCICSLAGAWDPAADRPAAFDMLQRNAVPDYSLQGLLADPGAAGVMATLFFGVAGGLGMSIFGLGMQTAKPRAAVAATLTALATTLIFMLAGVGMWTGDAPLAMRVWHGLMTVVLLLTTCLTAAAWFALREVDSSWFSVHEPAGPEDLEADRHRRREPIEPPAPDSLEALQAHRRRLAEENARLDAIERALRQRERRGGGSPPHDGA